jgi:hypothetical protein
MSKMNWIVVSNPGSVSARYIGSWVSLNAAQDWAVQAEKKEEISHNWVISQLVEPKILI